MSIPTYKLTRMGIMAAIVVSAAAACHSNDYKTQGAVPGADSVSTATAAADSTAAAPTPATASTKPVAKAKAAHGHASITLPKVNGEAETAPQFPGGQPALDKYVTDNVNYPQQAIDDDMSGIVHVSFVVDEQGNVTNAKVLDPSKVGDGLEQEALRVVKAMPSWKPGRINGKKVRTHMQLPISFQVES